MNQTAVAILTGFIAGIVGGYFGQSLGSAGGGAEGTLEVAEVETLREDVAALKTALGERRAAEATLAAREPGAEAMLGAEADSRVLSASVEEALMARVDERVATAVEKKLDEMGDGASGSEEGQQRRGRKRVTLAEAAAELELSAQQEDELRRVYEDSERKVLEMLAGPDGDPEEVKREIQEAVKEPGGPQKMIGKYAPKFMSNIGTILTLQAEREAAIVKAVGPEKARQLQSDYTVKEDDFLGLRGAGGGMRFGATVQTEGR